jgi:Tripartite tricarboxylate transporter TctB family
VADHSAEARQAVAVRGERGRHGLLPAIITGDRIFASVLLAVGVIAVVQGIGYRFIRADGIIGAGFTPIVFGVLLIFCSAMVLVSSFRGGSAADKSASPIESLAEQTMLEAQDDVAPTERVGSERSAMFVAVGIGVSLWLAGWIGLIPALAVLVLVILRWIEKESWLKSILIAVGLAVASWFIFTYFLQVPLNFGVLTLYWHI